MDDPDGSEAGESEALDAFVQVLRGFGRHAFELDHENVLQFSRQCEAWARHIAVLTAPPAQDGAGQEDSNSSPSSGGRDWPSVVRFFITRRTREQQYVSRALGDLRQSIWAFAQSVGMALIEDQRVDASLKDQIERLKVALEQLSPEELKEAVVATATSLSSVVSERQRMQRQRLEALAERVTDLTGQLREAREESVRDPLTQLVNRKGFDEFLNRMVFMRDVFAETASMLLVDLDHFKVVNDTYGHRAGDLVLKAVADCLVRNFPRKNDLVARYGGEELAIVLPATPQGDARRLAERVRAAVGALRVPASDQIVSVTVSVGVAQLGQSESIQDWIDRVDQALYRAKAEGRNCVAEARTDHHLKFA